MQGPRSKGLEVALLCLSIAGLVTNVSAQALYVGTQAGETGEDGKVYAYFGARWIDLTPSGLGGAFAVMDLAFHDGRLYAGVQSRKGYGGGSGEGHVWRYDLGSGWTQVGTLDNSVMVLEAYDKALFAGTNSTNLYQCWVCDGTDWTQVTSTRADTGFRAGAVSTVCGAPELFLGELNTDAFWRHSPTSGLQHLEDHGGGGIWDLVDHDGDLYAGAWAGSGPIYRTVQNLNCADPSFETIYATGQQNWALESFQGQLYVGAGGFPAGTLWTYGGAQWTVVREWPKTVPNEGVSALAAHGDEVLYIGLGLPAGYHTGDGRAEVFSFDGLSFEPISPYDHFAGGVQCMQISDISDTDGDDVPDFEDNCPLKSNTDQVDHDHDGVGNACDNCILWINPNQADCNGNGQGDHCESQEADGDGDGVFDICDNCSSVPNSGQADSDGDGEGDTCDLDDGWLYFTDMSRSQQSWQDEGAVYGAYNLYRGDLEELQATGVYSQDPLAVPEAEKFCSLGPTPSHSDAFEPAAGQVAYYLVTGWPATCGESSLGSDSSGRARPNANRCSFAQQLTISFSIPGKHLISLPIAVDSPGISDAQDLYDALDAAGLGPVSVAKWDPCLDDWFVWEGVVPPDPFLVDPRDGIAYLVEVTNTPGELVLNGVGFCASEIALVGAPCSGLNTVSLPFLSPLSNASDLLADVGPTAVAVGRYLTATDTVVFYPGSAGNFPIVAGEGYFVHVTTHTIYTPSHF